MPKMQVTMEFDFDESKYIFRKDLNATQSKKNVIIKDAVASRVEIAMRSQGYDAEILTVRKKQS
jgi:uncharacterized membrane protein